ncbi:NF-X1-type zinc finger protein NFXL1-like [Bolinopsis microptera]|uniref:NF-X1-type zinc finger protein NFXL1-like n=1 Tax=Bolinopsis microptera TaxID=2820187 RepID=UPI003079FB70
MSNLSHLSGKRARGRGRGAVTQQPRSQLLSVPGRGVAPTPRVAVPVTPTWGPTKHNGHAKEEKKLPQYVIPENFLSSDEEEEVDQQVLVKVLGSYGEDREGLQSKLADLYNTSSSSCLVCISTVRHAEPVWSCPQCSDSFHLVCIQKWARDGIKAPSVLSAELFPNKDVPWFCPKCREEFSRKQIPTRYYCYCTKKVDPVYDPWIAPHSCGEVCDKPLTSNCGHSCLLLCHPGRCPPCPKQVLSSCYCGGRRNETRRCGQARWSCGGVCNKPLQCGQHACYKTCHEGECAPCERESLQSCRCSKESALRQCLKYDWQCARVCSKPLPCGNHKCMETCHSGRCEPCPPSLRATCPCGKTPLSKHYPCDAPAPTCELSCDKSLPCGQHSCFRVCHLGPCDTCLQVRDKPCRCGKTHKEVTCAQELTCEIKCNKEKECGRHTCKRKCCPGRECGECDKRCDKTLPCRNHKCVSDCHPGRCYPCPGKVDVKCACAHTKVVVACGRERSTRPPRCNKSCNAAPDCHHETREPHRCHFKACPTCKQICGMKLSGCAHVCAAPCHDQVVVPSKGPGEPTIVKKSCPPCSVLEQLECKGGHEISTVKCSEAAPYSCLRPCGRLLPCGNHTCDKECHDPGDGCSTCEEMCARTWDCPHQCTRACHPGSCPPCRQYLRLPCHCGILHLSVKCTLFSEKKDLETLLGCGSQCSKLISCQHTCRKTCHLGSCSKPTECKKKVSLYCACRKVKKDYKCGEACGKEDELSPKCGEECKIPKQPIKHSDVEKYVSNKEEPEQGPKRRWRGRKKTEEPSQPSFISNHGAKISALLALCVALAGIYFCTLEP